MPRIGSDDDLELMLSKLLAGGVLLSGSILVIGMVALLLTRQTGYPPTALDFGQVHPEAYPHSLPSLIDGLRHGRPLAILSLGLLVLVATPVLRVASSIVLFFRQRDFLYTGICTFVLLMLLLGMALGGA